MKMVFNTFFSFLPSGVIMFEKFGVMAENRTSLDRLISILIMAHNFMLAPSAIFMMYRNAFGPFDNLNIVIGIHSVQLFGQISTCLMLLQIMFAWYIKGIYDRLPQVIHLDGYLLDHTTAFPDYTLNQAG
jgi:hypothetical protein